MTIAFWLALLLAFYWLMVETKWLKIRILFGKIPKYKITDVVPVILAAAIVIGVMIKTFDVKEKSKPHWWQKIFKKRIKLSPIEKLIIGMYYLVASELVKNLTKDIRSKV